MVIVQSFIAGLLSYAAFAPINLWWLAPVSLTLLVTALTNQKFRTRLSIVFIYGIGFFAPLLTWSNIYVGNLPWILLFLLESTLLLPLAIVPFSRNRPYLYLLFPSTLVAIEALQSRFPFRGFGWGRLAFSQADAPYSYIARWGGVPSLSFTLATISVLIYFIVSRNFKYGLLLFLFIASATPLFISHRDSQTQELSILAVQGGVPTMGLDFNARARAVFTMHLQATKSYLAHATELPDVILWPENAVDVDPLVDPIVNADLRNLVDKWQVPIILGAVLNNGRNFSNASILWQPKLGPTSIYRKEHLTPFGEYIPWRPLAEALSPYAKNVIDFVPGKTITIHDVGKARIGPLICFEIIDDSLGRSIARSSNLLLVQTNNATFGRSAQSRQQLGISRIRAIEHGRYLVSVSTTGISAIVDSNGKVLKQTKEGQVAVMQSKVVLIASRTFSDRYGGLIEVLLALLPPIFLLIARGFSSRRKKSQAQL